MITQNTLLDFFTKAPQVSREKQLGIGVEKSSAIPFKDTFNNAVEKVRGSDTKRYAPGEEKDRAVNGENGGYKSYREAQMYNRRQEAVNQNKPVKNLSGRIDESDTDLSQRDDGENGDSTLKTEGEMYTDVIANILGMTPGDLNKALESMNIEPEELTDSKGASEALNKLAAALGLDEGQKQALADILKLLKVQMESRMGKLFQEGSVQLKSTGKSTPAAKEDNENASGAATGKKLENQPASELEEIIARLKSKIEELSQKLAQNPQKLSAEFAEEIRNLMGQYRTQQFKTGNREAVGETGEMQGMEQAVSNKPDDSAVKPIKPDKEVKGDIKEVNKEDNEDASGTVEEVKSAAAPESKEAGQNIFRNVNAKAGKGNNAEVGSPLSSNVQKSSGNESSGKIFKEAPVSKNEVFSQIIEKAKVVTNGGKSEMVMELKPESLGKLSLKIVTEQGIVSAKFIAENQQVKEIIESNMQLLKDSLEKQGLSVQGFSVSVGQQSSNGYGRGNESEKGSRNTEGRLHGINTGTVGIRSISDNLDRANPYNISENRINLTA